MTHIPVMTAEVLQHLRPEQGGLFVDCTVGLGGHSRALLEAGATRVIGLDRDPDALARARETLAPWGDRVELVHADYRAIDEVLESRRIASVDGALADLGVSSMQFDAPGRGFSFMRDEPLDMRMDRTAAKPRPIWSRSRASAIWPTRSSSTAKSASRGASRAPWSRRAARRRSTRPAGSRRSSAARSRIAAATCASIRRPGRFRRCASGSTASSTGSIASSRRPRAGCAPARGWS